MPIPASARFDVAFEKAVKFFQSRIPSLQDAQFEALGATAHQQAFTIAGITQLSLVNDVWKAIDKAILDGADFKQFQKDVKTKLEAAWGGPKPARLETIWRTNLQSSYNAGRYAQITQPEVLAARPVWIFDSVLDSRSSTICKPLNGVTLPATDPFWDTHIPPLHHRCRSSIRTARVTEKTQYTDLNKITFDPPAATFGIRPDQNVWVPESQKYAGTLWDAFEQQRMEKSPKLNTKQLPKNLLVPRDTLLRGASPQEVVGALRAATAKDIPTPKGVQFFFMRDESDYQKMEQRWTQLRIKQLGNKTSKIKPTKIDRDARAIRFLGEVLISPKTVSLLESHDMIERAQGATTILHEWWHGARTQVEAYYPFEEGTADVFASHMTKKLLGMDKPNAWGSYPDLSEGIERIGEALQMPEWYFESRKQADVKQWLESIFKNAGFSDTTILKVLSYNDSGRGNKIFESIWLQHVKDMIESR